MSILVGSFRPLSDLKFTEGHKYGVQRLHYIDSENNVTDVMDAEVVFTAGWVCVTEESSEPMSCRESA